MELFFAGTASDDSCQPCFKGYLSLFVFPVLLLYPFLAACALLSDVPLGRPPVPELVFFEPRHIYTAALAHPNSLGNTLYSNAASVIGILTAVAEHHVGLVMFLVAYFTRLQLVDELRKGELTLNVSLLFASVPHCLAIMLAIMLYHSQHCALKRRLSYKYIYKLHA